MWIVHGSNKTIYHDYRVHRPAGIDGSEHHAAQHGSGSSGGSGSFHQPPRNKAVRDEASGREDIHTGA